MATLGYPYRKNRQNRHHVQPGGRKKLRLLGEMDFRSAVKTMNNIFEEDLEAAVAEQEARAKKRSNDIIALWQSNAVEMEQKKTGQELGQTPFTFKEEMSNKNKPLLWPYNKEKYSDLQGNFFAKQDKQQDQEWFVVSDGKMKPIKLKPKKGHAEDKKMTARKKRGIRV
eukprot:3939522-Rhodomonas_salina.1